MKRAVKVAVTAGTIGLLVWLVPWRALWRDAQRLDPGTWALALLAFVVAHLVGSFKWRLNVNVGRARLGAVDAVRCYWAGLFANLFLPSIVGGDAVRAVLAARLTRRYEAVVFGSLADRLIDVLALCVLILTGGLLSRAAVPGWAGNLFVIGGLVALAGGLLLLPLAWRRPLERWPRKVRRPLARALVAARRLVRRPGLALGVLGLSVGMQGSFVLVNAGLGAAVGVDVPMSVWVLAWPMAKAISLAPISLGGYGVREAALAGILHAAAGVPIERGVLVSILWQTVLLAGGLLGGILWWSLGRATRRAVRAAVERGPAPAVAGPEAPRG